jgi:hypothetical protein
VREISWAHPITVIDNAKAEVAARNLNIRLFIRLLLLWFSMAKYSPSFFTPVV